MEHDVLVGAVVFSVSVSYCAVLCLFVGLADESIACFACRSYTYAGRFYGFT